MFTWIARDLQKANIEFQSQNPILGNYRTPFTSDLVKKHIWKPIQKTLYNKESTKDLITTEINEILDLLTVHYAQVKIKISFPNKHDLYLKYLQETYNY
jgi:hypothetical protein